MPTLSVPPADPTVAITAQSIVDFEATLLFVERARALDANFAVTDATAPVIAEICRRLDGIALAIELAAARVRVLAPAQLRDRLDQRLKLLKNVGAREAAAAADAPSTDRLELRSARRARTRALLGARHLYGRIYARSRDRGVRGRR